MNFFIWEIPNGPDAPFSTPLLSVLDSVRVLIVVCSVATLLFLIPAMRMTWTKSQTYRIVCLGIFSVYVMLTEIQRLGDYGNWRLIVGAMVAIWTVFAVVGFIQFEGNPERTPKYLRWMVRKKNSATSHESFLKHMKMSSQSTSKDRLGRKMKRIGLHRRGHDHDA